ncbi:MAG: DMT family transporter [Acidobacteriota bacterium]
MAVAYAGEIAAFGTVLCWTVGSQCFEAAGKKVGSLTVNLLRLILAFGAFCVTLTLARGYPVPLDFPARAWGTLALSGLVGFTLGDLCLIRSFVEIGPRVAMLIMTLAAPISAVIGWAWLGEDYSARQWCGMGVTLSGVAWVVLDRPAGSGFPSGEDPGRGRRRVRRMTPRGVALALVGTVGQAVGYVLSKYGMRSGGVFLDPFAATQIRVMAGGIGFVVLFFLLRRWNSVWVSLRDGRAMAFMTAGAIAGPYLGVSLSLLALHYTSTGVAATITALVPVVLIPSVVLINREHVSARAAIGAAVAVGGVALLVFGT